MKQLWAKEEIENLTKEEIEKYHANDYVPYEVRFQSGLSPTNTTYLDAAFIIFAKEEPTKSNIWKLMRNLNRSSIKANGVYGVYSNGTITYYFVTSFDAAQSGPPGGPFTNILKMNYKSIDLTTDGDISIISNTWVNNKINLYTTKLFGD